jgi:hypothetical protein
MGDRVDGLVEEHNLDELKEMADERGLATYGTKQQVAQRIVDHDADDELDDDEPESDDDAEESAPVSEPDAEPDAEPLARAGGYVIYDDDRGWVPDPDVEPEAAGPEAPVEAGDGGLPGHPHHYPAGWSVPEGE